MQEHQIDVCLPITAEAAPGVRLAALFDAHYDRLYRLARRLTPCADDALDLVQDTFLKAAGNTEKVPSGFANGEAWLVRVLIKHSAGPVAKSICAQTKRRFPRRPSP